MPDPKVANILLGLISAILWSLIACYALAECAGRWYSFAIYSWGCLLTVASIAVVWIEFNRKDSHE